jgi:hypothetical protein
MQLALANWRRARGISTGTTAVHFYRCIRRIRRTWSLLIACDRLDSGPFAGFATLVHIYVINILVCDCTVQKLVSGCNPTVDIEVGHGIATVCLLQYCAPWAVVRTLPRQNVRLQIQL